MNSILRHWTKLGRANRVAFFRTVADNLAETPSPLPNPNPPLALTVSDPPTQAEMQQVVDKLKELIAALFRPPV